MQKHYFKFLFLLMTSSLIDFNLYAQLPHCERGVNFADLDINNVKARHWASGNMWYDTYLAEPHYEVPKGGGNHSLFSFDFWFGAVDEMGRRRTVFQKYSGASDTGNKYFPGPLDNTGDTFPEICAYYDRVWKINKSTLDSFRLGLFADVPKDILEWPARNNPHIPFSPEDDLAPFRDANGDNNYNPMDGDIPKILGDQTLWWSFNDKGGYGSPYAETTLQIDGWIMAYAYNSVPELENHTFYKYSFTNKSNLRLDSVMVGMFVEADLGQYDDDFVGCDTLRNMGIFYNADEEDGDYGTDIPMVGIKILQGTQKEDDTYSDMYTCWHRGKDWSVWGLPEHEESAFNGLWGLSAYGNWAMSYGGNGLGLGTPPTTRYMYPSDPTDVEGWSECSENNPSYDRHLVMSVGPTTMQHLEKKELHFAVLWVREGVEYPCPSFAPLQEAADYVQNMFDNGLITNIEEKPASSHQNTRIHLFPNPATANTVLYLEQKQALQKGTLQLFDSLGKLVESATLKENRQNEVRLSDLQSGIYFYQLQWENGKVENGKFVVN